ncbi:phage tail protein [Phormidesmis sp. 146-35]
MRSITGIQATPHLRGQRIDLSWQNPPASEFDTSGPLTQVCIMRQERTYPLAPNPDQSVYYGPVINQFSDRDLQPLTTYYYTLFTQDRTGAFYAGDQSRYSAFATQDYNLTERLYKLLPAVHLRYDLPLTAPEIGRLSPSIQTALLDLPPGLRDRGQLWRFFAATASSMDLMRSLAEGLPQLHDLDRVRPDFLPLLAQWLGWDLDNTQPISSQRNEVKAAPSYYRTVGTVPNLRNLVTRYTGWYTQVAEFAQAIVRSNSPPQFNVFAIQQVGTTWRGTDDAALVLGFGSGNNTTIGTDPASGVAGTPATLISSQAAPFRLRPGMEFAVTADDRVPVSVRFQPGDFLDIQAATVGEVVAVLNRTLSEVSAIARADNRIELRSHLLGAQSSLRVEQYATSLVTLEGALKGRLAAFKDRTARIRLFYETVDLLAPVTTWAAQPGVATTSIELTSLPQGRIRYKTFRSGTWGESYPLMVEAPMAQGAPTVVELPDGSLWIAWIEQPDTDQSRLRFSRQGTVRNPQPAYLIGQRSQPFELKEGMRLVLRGNWEQPYGIEFAATDFPNFKSITATQLVGVLNARLQNVNAAVDASNPSVISLRTIGTGGDEYLELDLGLSTAATALGFDQRNALAQGDWGDEVDWSPSEDITITGLAPGRHADLQAIADNTGAVWLFWSTFASTPGGPFSSWQIVSSRWNGTAWSAMEILTTSLGGNREACTVLDASDRLWLFWSQRQGIGTPEDIWTLRQRVFTPGTGWSPETAVTTPPATGRFADREPSVLRMPDNTLQVFFQSDRSGSSDLWSVTINPTTSTIGTPTPVTTGAPADRAPAPIRLADDTLWLLYRSDRSVPLSRIATRSISRPDNRLTAAKPATKPTVETLRLGRSSSVRSFDTGTLKHFAGHTSVSLSDFQRLSRRRQWDDLLSYTPQKPVGLPLEEDLRDDEYYTRGTVGLYLSPIIPNNPLTQQRVERLRPLLRRFLPANTRAVVILSPRTDIEFVYPPGRDLQDAYVDRFPFVEYYTGLADSATVALPDWVLFRSNTPGNITANPTDLTTLRNRTYFPPPL